MDIKFYNRETKKVEIEKVYGDKAVKWLYGSALGKFLSPVICSSALSHFYGLFQSAPQSVRKIKPFISNFHINMEDYIEEDYKSFNDFFIRRFKEGKRNFPLEPKLYEQKDIEAILLIKKLSRSLKFP